MGSGLTLPTLPTLCVSVSMWRSFALMAMWSLPVPSFLPTKGVLTKMTLNVHFWTFVFSDNSHHAEITLKSQIASKNSVLQNR